MKHTQNLLRTSLPILFFLTMFIPSTHANGSDGNDRATVNVESHRGSSMIMINVLNHRKIGSVLLELKSRDGVVLYREEGKSMSTELVRRLDKGLFPKGDHTLTVTAKDFSITQAFSVE